MGFYLDTLEDEFLSLLTSLSPKPDAQFIDQAEEREEVAHKGDGWMEVGRKNRTVVTRTVWYQLSVLGRSNILGRPRLLTLLSHGFLEGPSVLHFAYRSARILWSWRAGEHYNSTSRFSTVELK